MTSILGIHLVLLGFGALLLVYKAVSLGGIYDTRRVSHPTLRPFAVWWSSSTDLLALKVHLPSRYGLHRLN